MGGGPYDDKHVSDEFYWAAAELFMTTKKDVYKTFLIKSPHFKAVPIASGDEGIPTPMTWGETEALGTITLAVVRNGLDTADIVAARKNIQAAADAYLDLIKTQGYRVPFKPGSKGFPWGSNSFVLNNMIVMALAHDFTHEQKYLDGVGEGMSYLLGRNPMDQSYVTGYGERPLEHPHHRFWAHQANAAFPGPAAGRGLGRPELRPSGSLRAGRGAGRAARRRSASSTTSKPGRPTRSPSTGTRRWRGSPRSSTRRASARPRPPRAIKPQH